MTFLEHPLWKHLAPYAVDFGNRTFFAEVPAELRALALEHAVCNCAKCGEVINPLIEDQDRIVYVPICDDCGKTDDRGWLVEARKVILAVADKLEAFSADDVWAAGLAKPHEPRALGYVMRELSREGRIELTGDYHRTTQERRHSAPVVLWRICRPRAA